MIAVLIFSACIWEGGEQKQVKKLCKYVSDRLNHIKMHTGRYTIHIF